MRGATHREIKQATWQECPQPTGPAPGPHPGTAGQALLSPPTQKHRATWAAGSLLQSAGGLALCQAYPHPFMPLALGSYPRQGSTTHSCLGLGEGLSRLKAPPKTPPRPAPRRSRACPAPATVALSTGGQVLPTRHPRGRGDLCDPGARGSPCPPTQSERQPRGRQCLCVPAPACGGWGPCSDLPPHTVHRLGRTRIEA